MGWRLWESGLPGTRQSGHVSEEGPTELSVWVTRKQFEKSVRSDGRSGPKRDNLLLRILSPLHQSSEAGRTQGVENNYSVYQDLFMWDKMNFCG